MFVCNHGNESPGQVNSQEIVDTAKLYFTKKKKQANLKKDRAATVSCDHGTITCTNSILTQAKTDVVLT